MSSPPATVFKQTPLVSICIPTYNNASMLGDALASAMAQSHESVEIVVLDNHSTDATSQVVSRVAGADERVRYVRHADNIGMAGNFNAALQMARGELLLILCADDTLEPTCVATLSSALNETPSAVLAACSRKIVDGQLRTLKIIRPRPRRQTVKGADLILECFARNNIVGEPSAVMFRRSAAVRGFREDYHQLLDLEMWFHLLLRGDAVLVPEALACIRRHDGQWSNANMRSGRLLTDKRALFRDFAPGLRAELSTGDRLLWDARMASSVEQTRLANGRRIDDVQEVFHPIAFRIFLRLATAVYAAGARVTGLRA